ncbi:MAG: UDP-3-O-(3-hydroxymyristoyl)glucosamine N-acyltransferase [Thermodesulfovibrionales bacterium]
MKLRELASMLDGEIIGDHDIEVRGAAGIYDAGEGDITFLSDKRLMKECAQSKAAGVIVKDFIPEIDKPQVIVKNPYYAFARLLEYFYVKPLQPSGRSDLAFISEHAEIGKDVSIYPFVYISDGVIIGERTVIYPGIFIGEGTAIGSECILYPNVAIREKVRIGNRVIVHSGSVIGSDGFGYVFEGGKHHKIPQVGGVVIGDDVEIGANVTIDRATTGDTVIGSGTKIDNLVQIGHNVKIGENSIIVAQTAIGGSTEIGDFVTIAGQVGISDHTRIDSGSIIGAKSGVMGNVKKGAYSGIPAIPHRDWLKSAAIFARLPELSKRIRDLEEKIKIIERRQTDDRH